MCVCACVCVLCVEHPPHCFQECVCCCRNGTHFGAEQAGVRYSLSSCVSVGGVVTWCPEYVVLMQQVPAVSQMPAVLQGGPQQLLRAVG